MVVAVHGPHTWGQPNFARNADILVNLLAPLEFEFKALGLGGFEWEWNFGDGTITRRINGYEVTHIFPGPGTYTIKVTVQSGNGPRTAEITITVPDGELRELPEKEDIAA